MPIAESSDIASGWAAAFSGKQAASNPEKGGIGGADTDTKNPMLNIYRSKGWDEFS